MLTDHDHDPALAPRDHMWRIFVINMMSRRLLELVLTPLRLRVFLFSASLDAHLPPMVLDVPVCV